MQQPNLQIYALAKSNIKRELSKTQKEFNRLTLKIASLREEIQGFEAASIRIRQKMSTDIMPLTKEYCEQQAVLVRLFDKAYDSGQFKSKDKKKLEHLISTLAFELISDYRMIELKSIYDKYSQKSYAEIEEENQESSLETAKEIAEMMYGIHIDKDADLDTPEKFEAYMNEKMAEKEEEDKAHRAQKAEAQANRPKTEKQRIKETKQQEKIDQQAEEDKKLTQSVREVYMDLVKTFHPDKEQDEDEKVRKTAIMQRVISAYQDNDLTTLLQLQMEFERIDQGHLENLAEDRLVQFNKVLSRQCKELNSTLYDIKDQLSDLLQRNPLQIKSPATLDYFITSEIKSLKKQIKDKKSTIMDFENPYYLKTWIKNYEIPEPDFMSDFFSNFF
jgi:hypothetical protein